MEKNTIPPGGSAHCLIPTQYVNSKNNNVFVKNDTKENERNIEWDQINFQWIPILGPNKNLK